MAILEIDETKVNAMIEQIEETIATLEQEYEHDNTRKINDLYIKKHAMEDVIWCAKFRK